MLIGRGSDGRVWGSFTNRMIPGNTGGSWHGSSQNCYHWRFVCDASGGFAMILRSFNPTAPRQIQTLSQYQQSVCKSRQTDDVRILTFSIVMYL
jgi:hypothetical protein